MKKSLAEATGRRRISGKERAGIAGATGEKGPSSAGVGHLNRGAFPRRCRWLIPVVLLLTAHLAACHAQTTQMLLVGEIGQINALRRLLGGEPFVSIVVVPCRAVGTDVNVKDTQKYIRLYFPRTYEAMRDYEFIILTATEYDLLSPTQDRWMYDSICEGTGGINDNSVFSVVGTIMSAWANSLTSQAFPNDAAAVAERAGWRGMSLAFGVTINRDFRDPVLTLFLPFGVERAPCWGVSSVVVPREGSGTLAWQHGNFPSSQPYLAVWDYEKGRTFTCGSLIPGGWFNFPDNPYCPEILINMIFYSTKRKLIDDVQVFHTARSSIIQFSLRMGILLSLKDFIDAFGADTEAIEDETSELDAMYQEGVQQYIDLDFLKCQEHMSGVLARFSEAEKMAMKIKDLALFWVYVVEWLVVSSVLCISGFALWTLMVRRRLYRPTTPTRLGRGLG